MPPGLLLTSQLFPGAHRDQGEARPAEAEGDILPGFQNNQTVISEMQPKESLSFVLEQALRSWASLVTGSQRARGLSTHSQAEAQEPFCAWC